MPLSIHFRIPRTVPNARSDAGCNATSNSGISCYLKTDSDIGPNAGHNANVGCVSSPNSVSFPFPTLNLISIQIRIPTSVSNAVPNADSNFGFDFDQKPYSDLGFDARVNSRFRYGSDPNPAPNPFSMLNLTPMSLSIHLRIPKTAPNARSDAGCNATSNSGFGCYLNTDFDIGPDAGHNANFGVFLVQIRFLFRSQR